MCAYVCLHSQLCVPLCGAVGYQHVYEALCVWGVSEGPNVIYLLWSVCVFVTCVYHLSVCVYLCEALRGCL